MHDPMTWSIPFGRIFGIALRVHWLFPFIALGQVLHAALNKPPAGFVYPPNLWIDVVILMVILFVSVLWHELGHCFAARSVGGEANHILMWPLGGLAYVDIPNRPRPHFVTAAAGPLFDLLLCVVCALVLLFSSERMVVPPFNPLPDGFPYRQIDGKVTLTTWSGEPLTGLDPLTSPTVWIARTFWVNWFLMLINLVLVGFPMDAGRMLQAALWPSLGYRHATQVAVFAGFAVVFLVGLYAIVFSSVVALALALFIYFACQREWIRLETGSDEGAFGYDFSQGYTSLERDQSGVGPTRARLSWWQRWLQRRAARRHQREREAREAEEQRLDALLDKVHREGRASLTEEEERFLKLLSGRYRRSQ